MKFILDENVEYRIAVHLRQQGHDVSFVARAQPSSLDDAQVLETARREGRILDTNDRDFGELIIRQNLAHAGVISFASRTEPAGEDSPPLRRPHAILRPTRLLHHRDQ